MSYGLNVEMHKQVSQVFATSVVKFGADCTMVLSIQFLCIYVLHLIYFWAAFLDYCANTACVVTVCAGSDTQPPL